MKKLLLFFIVASGFYSCKTLVPFTDSMKQRYNWTDEQIRSIQFYVSHDIILQRRLSNSSTEIVQGKIKMKQGKRVDEILIRSGTPGVLTEIPRENKMMVSFEMGDDHSLSFGINPNMGDKFVLLASEWNNGSGKVHYSGLEYNTDPDSRYAHLLVNLRKIDKMQVRQRIAGGRKIK
ncbi:MAG: hypothetical protein IPP77_08270 [Bacteroidetes bacterium]|nr:hypothetical protein [Bacteroidota bacterium]